MVIWLNNVDLRRAEEVSMRRDRYVEGGVIRGDITCWLIGTRVPR
jgi:hypothetical protein